MKRFFSAFLAALMIVMMIVPVNVGAADQATVTVIASADSVKVGDEVTFTVAISNAENVFSIAVIPSYDKDVYELMSGAWLLSGMLADFSVTEGNGVIAFDSAKTINENALTFTLKVKKPSANSAVSAEVILKNLMNDTIPNSTSGTTVTIVCEHTFGAWEKHNAEQHKHTCSACGETSYEAHKWDDGVVTTPATHLTEGEKTYTCTVCGEKKTEKIEKTTDHAYGAWTKHDDKQHKKSCECGDIVYADHNWNAGEITKPASHVATGVKTYTCTDCGETKTETLPKTEGHGFGKWEKHNAEQHKRSCECGEIEYADHNWNAGEITKKPTCKDEGVKTYTCKDCGETKTESIAKTNDHTYGAWTKDTADNHKHTCEICGKTETEAHKWNAGEITKPASHVSTGIKTYTCTECGETKTETLDKTTDHAYGEWTKHDDKQHKHSCECGDTVYADHNWNAGEITKAPTCKDTGVKTYTCVDCKATKTEVMDKTTDHKYGDWAKENETAHKHICSVCGKTESADHTWNAGEVTKAPTCKDTGVKTYTCTACGATKTETLDKTTEHKWNAGEVTKAPTCKDTGVKISTCTVCGETKTDIIPTTTNHVFGAWEKCDETVHTHACSVCGKTENRSHEWDKGVTTIQPSAGKDGEAVYTCTVCGEQKTVVLSATHKCSYGDYKYNDTFHWQECSICLGKQNTKTHTWDNGTVIEPATHTTVGKIEYTCTVCDITKTETLSLIKEHTYSAWTSHDGAIHKHVCECGDIEYAAHSFSEWTVVTAPTTTAVGIEKATCADCGVTVEREIAKLPEIPQTEESTTVETTTETTETTVTTSTTETDPADETAPVIVPIIIIVVVAAAAGIVIAVIVIKKKKA